MKMFRRGYSKFDDKDREYEKEERKRAEVGEESHHGDRILTVIIDKLYSISGIDRWDTVDICARGVKEIEWFRQMLSSPFFSLAHFIALPFLLFCLLSPTSAIFRKGLSADHLFLV